MNFLKFLMTSAISSSVDPSSLESSLVDLMALELDSTGMLAVAMSAMLLVTLWLSDFSTSISTNY